MSMIELRDGLWIATDDVALIEAKGSCVYLWRKSDPGRACVRVYEGEAGASGTATDIAERIVRDINAAKDEA